jgi:hypothetical protein
MDEKKTSQEVVDTYNPNGSDIESTSKEQQGKLVRQLKNRHVAMIRCVDPVPYTARANMPVAVSVESLALVSSVLSNS